MSRDDLLNTNAGIVKQVSEQIRQSSPNAILIIVSNPLDVMCYVAKQVSGFPRERVLGMAGVLDTARYRGFLAEALDVSVRDIQAMVLGGHGDTMVPLISYTSVSGIPVTQLMSKEKLDAIVDRTRNGGAEIVKHLKTGSAYYAPSAAAAQIVNDQRRIWAAPRGSKASTEWRPVSRRAVQTGRTWQTARGRAHAGERAALESAEAAREPSRASSKRRRARRFCSTAG
jgi:malate dehydrogenase